MTVMTKIRLSLLVAGCLTLASCQSPPVQLPAPQTDSNPDSAALGYQIAQQTWCSNDQACSMMLHLIYGRDPYSDFASRYEALAFLNVARGRWKLQAEKPVTKGALSYMLCRALDYRGGVMFHLLPIRRYAYRELLDKQMISPGADFEPLTGPEAIGIFSRAAQKMAEKKAASPPAMP